MMSAADPHVEALAWALVAFLWQGTLLGLAVAGLMGMARTAQTRYALGVAGILAMLAAPIATYVSRVDEDEPVTTRVVREPSAAIAGGPVTGLVLADDPRQAASLGLAAPRGAVHAETEARPAGSDAAALATPVIVAVWLTGVALLTLRLLGGWFVAHRLAGRATGPADVTLQALAADVARRLALTRAVAIVDSAAVAVPTVVGWVKPVVLMPAAGLAGLSICQLEAILAHELAHVRRHDYLVNLLQSAIETLLFYHPAVWWLSRRVRSEREHCCDDLAVDVCGDRVAYVSALAQLAALDAKPRLALAATDGSLLARVARLLGQPSRARELPSPSIVLVLLVATLVVSSVSAGLLRADAAAGADEIEEPATIADEVTAPDVVPAARPIALVSPEPPPRASRALERVSPAPAMPVVPPLPSVPAGPPVPSAASVPSVPVVPSAFDAPTPLSAPVPPTAPEAPPVPPAPPSAPAEVEAQADGRGHVTWSNRGERYDVAWTGRFTLTDDDRDLASVESGATVKISEGRFFTTRVELRGLPGGGIERRFFRSGFERPYEPEGQRWLAAALQRLIERAGLFAEHRVARLLQTGGVDAVFAAIDRLQSDSGYARRRYYQQLLAQAPNTGALLGRITERVSREHFSDYERAQVLTRVAASPAATDVERAAVAAASATMDSDYEQRRVLAATMTDVVSEPVAMAILGAAGSLGGDYDRAKVLTTVAARGGVTPATGDQYLALAAGLDSSYEQRKALVALAQSTHTLASDVAIRAARAAGKIDSDYERRVALQRLLAQAGTSPEVVGAMLDSTNAFDSSYERAQVLLDLVQRGGLTDDTSARFFKAAASLSGHEHRRVLEAALDRPLSSSTLIALLGNAGHLPGEYERGRVLLRVAATQTLSPETRTRYLDVADTLDSDHEQTRVLAALVRAERKATR